MKKQDIYLGAKGFKIWYRKTNLNNLSMTKKFMKDLNFTGHDICLEDLISWKSYKGAKKFTEIPQKGCIKIPRLSYNKFLTIFSEIVLHFIGRNLSSFHLPLVINPPTISTQASSPPRQSEPAVLPAMLSPIAPSPPREMVNTEENMEEDRSYHLSRIFVLPERLPPPEVPPTVQLTTTPDHTLTPFLADISKNDNITGGIKDFSIIDKLCSSCSRSALL